MHIIEIVYILVAILISILIVEDDEDFPALFTKFEKSLDGYPEWNTIKKTNKELLKIKKKKAPEKELSIIFDSIDEYWRNLEVLRGINTSSIPKSYLML